MAFTTNITHRLISIDTAAKVMEPDLIRMRQAYVDGPTECGALKCESLNLGSFSCGTNPLSCNALSSTTVTASGTMAGVSLTCNSLACDAFTTSDPVSFGTKSITCGDFTCSNLISSGTISGGSNAMTCGDLLRCTSITASGAIECSTLSSGNLNCLSNITSSGLNYAPANSFVLTTSTNNGFMFVSGSNTPLGIVGLVSNSGAYFATSRPNDICVVNNASSNRILMGPAATSMAQVTASGLSVSRGSVYSRGEIHTSGRLGNGSSVVVNDPGLHLQWDCVAGNGVSYFINQRGAYPGGISFGAHDTTNYYELMFISNSGAVSMNGNLAATSVRSTGGSNYYNLGKLTAVSTGGYYWITRNSGYFGITIPQVWQVTIICPDNGAGSSAYGSVLWYTFTNGGGLTPVLTNLGSTNITWDGTHFDTLYYYLGFMITGVGNVDAYVMYEVHRNYSG